MLAAACTCRHLFATGAEGALGVSANDIEQESNDMDLKLSHGSSAGVHVRISHGFDGHSICRCDES